MNEKSNLNERGNHQEDFTQGVGGWAEYTVSMTLTSDIARHDVKLPPKKLIPVIFIPGVMGSNLRMSVGRRERLNRSENYAWRPDEITDAGGKANVVTGTGLGGWFKNATPAQRQLNFDPNETEVDLYRYTESKSKFDPQGKETIESDMRHRNVPDGLDAIPPLLGRTWSFSRKADSSKGKAASPAQIARWRGWSEVLFGGAYGKMLRHAEHYLNNMVHEGGLNKIWRTVLGDPRTMGAKDGAALTEEQIQSISKCWYPVHSMGYNFLKGNGESARVLAERIAGLVKGYQKRGFQCNEVILVTHSMGGLVARALLHPRYGNLLNSSVFKILGVYHNVMPSSGAAATYKRMRFGFQDRPGILAGFAARVLSINGEHATAILANAQGPLELLPSTWYGTGWLKVVDGAGNVLDSWPKEDYSALKYVYLQPETIWWRLINPKWVNPARLTEDEGGGIAKVHRRIENAIDFIESICSTFHPSQTYASYCNSKKRQCFGEVVFKIMDKDLFDTSKTNLAPVTTWVPVSDDARGNLTVKAGNRILTLSLQPPSSSGDETVPAERSARMVGGMRFVHGTGESDGYEHQDSYSQKEVLDAMLYAVASIALTADWKGK
ncbi:hypothetical protein [Massilia sp. METH4]|uniref:PGAP1-like alpha/beta domain-containing protein n=1 Tax=Massilia sp. METH4 TaxID=3123041 RepID=UPI0030CDFC1A